jgi:hypothetical protein
LAPLQSLTRDPPRRLHLAVSTCARSLPRFCAPTALPTRQDPHTPGRLPARVTLRPRAYHAPRRLTPSASSLVSFQPGAPTGHCPSERYLTEIADASQRSFPSCDWLPTALADTRPAFLRTPEIGRHEDVLIERAFWAVPLGWMVLQALSAHRHLCQAASLQGFHPSAGWGHPPPDFSTCGTLALLGLHPPWGIPLPSLSLSGHHIT